MSLESTKADVSRRLTENCGQKLAVFLLSASSAKANPVEVGAVQLRHQISLIVILLVRDVVEK